MSTMVKTFCDTCGKQCSDVSIYDLPYILETTCWDCNKNDKLWSDFVNSHFNKMSVVNDTISETTKKGGN